MTKPHILIVEDNFIVAADLANKVRQLGYGVVGPIGTGEEAVALAVQHRPALVLMDIQLGGAMDGIAAAIAIRQAGPVPVVFLSGNSDAATVERTRQAGACGSITKPFDDSDVRRQIELALGGSASPGSAGVPCA